MKKFVRLVCMLLVLSTMMVIPAVAAETTTPRASGYFMSSLGYLHQTHPTIFRAWGEVDAVDVMDKLGMSSITIQRSSDNQNWTDMKTYTKETNTNLVRENTASHEAYVTYVGTAGYYYRAQIWFYAKKGTGTAEYSYTTGSILLG